MNCEWCMVNGQSALHRCLEYTLIQYKYVRYYIKLFETKTADYLPSRGRSSPQWEEFKFIPHVAINGARTSVRQIGNGPLKACLAPKHSAAHQPTLPVFFESDMNRLFSQSNIFIDRLQGERSRYYNNFISK